MQKTREQGTEAKELANLHGHETLLQALGGSRSAHALDIARCYNIVYMNRSQLIMPFQQGFQGWPIPSKRITRTG